MAASLGGRLLLAAGCFLLVMPAVAAAPPADAFCVILIQPNEDFSLITVKVDEESEIEDRVALWPSVDLDRNGVVTPVEKEAWRWNQTQVWTDPKDLGVKAVTLQQDAPYTKSPEQRALYATSWRQIGHVFHKQEYQLPDVLSVPSELETQEVREFGFELVGGEPSRIVLRGGREAIEQGRNLTAAPSYTEEPKPVIEYVVIEAPRGWRVERVEGMSYNGTFVIEPKERSVDVPAFDTKSPYTILFMHPQREKEQSELDGPGLGAFGVAAALAVAGLLWRRRPRAPADALS